MKKARVKNKKELERVGFLYTGLIKGKTEIMNKDGDIIFKDMIGKDIEVKPAPENTGYDFQCKKYFFKKNWLHINEEK